MALVAAAHAQETAPRPLPPEVVQRDGQPVARADFALQGRAVQGGVLTGLAPARTVALSLDGMPVPLAADGRFLIAFDRDAAPQATLRATRADGSDILHRLTIAPGVWRIERIDAPMRPTRSTAAFLALRAPELERIAAARTIRSDSQGWRQSFLWPVRGRISGLFGAQRVYRGEPAAYHGGVDIAAATGTPVRAPADGVVILAAQAPFTLEGHLLMIDHGAGLNSAFLHLSRIDVTEGTQVRQGQVIGAVGATGRATGPHLHWGMKWNDARIDPLPLAGPMPR
ncbi:M23 family metallopeptidase [Sphingobium algorifonticola]|uniref:M23 family metallopeptidase n=1 Tax=Sphingobium algorifonticola TaxID=2008318 RepID=A0A437JAA0_9SPHN|nr:M23 family metallopeptidase [Sphingobium algorifonticola]